MPSLRMSGGCLCVRDLRFTACCLSGTHNAHARSLAHTHTQHRIGDCWSQVSLHGPVLTAVMKIPSDVGWLEWLDWQTLAGAPLEQRLGALYTALAVDKPQHEIQVRLSRWRTRQLDLLAVTLWAVGSGPCEDVPREGGDPEREVTAKVRSGSTI